MELEEKAGRGIYFMINESVDLGGVGMPASRMYVHQLNYLHISHSCFQVTTHSHLLSHDELNHVSNTLSLDQSHVHVFSLEEFDTELDFFNKVRYVNSGSSTM